jgi:hypothetical protein
MSQVYGNQTLDFQDISGAGLYPLKIDATATSTYRQFRLKNISSKMVEDIKVKLSEIGESILDVSQLAQRTSILLSYVRESSGGGEKQYLGVGPISVMTENPEELETVLINGWAQLSDDTFRWGNLLMLGPLQPGDYLDLYARYLPQPSNGGTETFQFSIRNIARDVFLGASLTASGSDLLSLDGQTFTQSVQIGDIAPAKVAIVWIQTQSIGTRIINGLIQALSAANVVATQLFWVDRGKPYVQPLMIFSISIGGTASADDEKAMLTDIEAFVAQNKKYVSAGNWSGTETGKQNLVTQ